MTITFWILLIFFGLMVITFTRKLLFSNNGVTKSEMVVLLVSVLIVAISAGVIFGGLKLF